MSRDDVLDLLAGFILGAVITGAVVCLTTLAARADDLKSRDFIKHVEAAMNVRPGDAKPWMACQCTVKYIGTVVKGGIYSVQLKPLD